MSHVRYVTSDHFLLDTVTQWVAEHFEVEHVNSEKMVAQNTNITTNQEVEQELKQNSPWWPQNPNMEY